MIAGIDLAPRVRALARVAAMGPDLGPKRDDTQAQGVCNNVRIPAGAGPNADDLTLGTDFGAVGDRAAAFTREGCPRMDAPSDFAAQDTVADFCFHGPIITRNQSRPDVVVSADITLRVDPMIGTGEIVIARVDGRSEVRGTLASDFIVAYAASFFAPTERITAMTRANWVGRISDQLLDRRPSDAQEIAAVEAEGWAVEMRQGEGKFDLPATVAPFNALIRSRGEYFLAVLEPIDEV